MVCLPCRGLRWRGRGSSVQSPMRARGAAQPPARSASSSTPRSPSRSPALVVLFETRLRETQVTRAARRADRLHHRHCDRAAITAGFFWLNAANQVVEFFDCVPADRPAVSGPDARRQARRSGSRAGAAHLLFRAAGPRSVATRFSTPASSSTAASPTSAKPASSTARSSSRSSC